jgi:hypothetical protein
VTLEASARERLRSPVGATLAMATQAAAARHINLMRLMHTHTDRHEAPGMLGVQELRAVFAALGLSLSQRQAVAMIAELHQGPPAVRRDGKLSIADFAHRLRGARHDAALLNRSPPRSLPRHPSSSPSRRRRGSGSTSPLPPPLPAEALGAFGAQQEPKHMASPPPSATAAAELRATVGGADGGPSAADRWLGSLVRQQTAAATTIQAVFRGVRPPPRPTAPPALSVASHLATVAPSWAW